MKILTAILLLFCTNSVTGHGVNEDLNKLVEDFQDWRLEQYPMTATSRGIYKYNDRLHSFNMSQFDVIMDSINGFSARLENITLAELHKDQKISYKMLRHILGAFRDGYRWRYYQNLNAVNFLEGIQKDVASMSVPMDTRGDVENYLKRLQTIPRQVDEIKERMDEAILLGRTNHRVSMTRIGTDFDALDVANISDSGLYKPFKESVAMGKIDYEDSERQAIRQKVETAVTEALASVKGLRQYIDNTYLNDTRESYGVNSFPNGTEYYKACMKYFLALDISPEEVHNIGLKEVARIEGRMMEILKRNNFVGSVRDYFASLENDSTLFYNTSEELLQAYRDIIAEVNPKLSQMFDNLPNLPVTVVPMSSDGPQGMYGKGSADGKTPGRFIANVLRPKDLPKYTLTPLTLHEASPGHHLQISYALVSSLPKFRQNNVGDNYFASPFGLPTFSSFSEGWALYAESLGEEMKLYKNDRELMGKFSSEIFRACRLVVDTGLHHYNWTREQAIDYVLNYTSFSSMTAATEIDRYITWPGQALTYKIGELKIKEWRNKSEVALGKHFDIKEFHSVVLRNGRMPLSLVEEEVNDWLKNYVFPPSTTETRSSPAPTKPTPTAKGCPTSSSTKTHAPILVILMLLILKSICY